MKQISIKQTLEHLSNGVTRTTDGKGYVAEIGSIEEKYDLTKTEVKEMFKHPLLANKKTRPPKSFILVDDVTEVENTTPAAAIPSAPAYGKRPVSSPSSSTEVEVNLSAQAPQEAEEEVITTSDVGNLTQDSLV